MQIKKSLSLLLALIALLSASLACRWSAERNDDGSWKVTGKINESELQDVLDDAIQDPQITGYNADFRAGYVLVEAQYSNTAGTHTDTMTFRIDMGIQNERLDVVISDVRVNGDPILEQRVDLWNARLELGLERAGQRNPNSTLQEVTITEDEVTMVWRVESRESRQDAE